MHQTNKESFHATWEQKYSILIIYLIFKTEFEYLLTIKYVCTVDYHYGLFVRELASSGYKLNST